MTTATTDITCINTCTAGCTNGERVKRVEYADGRVDYLTIQCACRGTLCFLCEEGYPCAVDGQDYSQDYIGEYDGSDFHECGPHTAGSDIDYADFDL